ncbi:hypothetical protein OHA40_24660 [Nocardia sp. NBC_00508]|uniref:hypothetical protein n=1 Tax=Nocardia sp. NBC_00508 TaxID=2975992 RepID=UPI002E8040BD|nr:hypothetical protein [Nocardia sp. NBC_00508]WUD64847.1 hypothetical protein OHA40_24660 [Nocardia sp. NBC_00508]
MAELHVNDLPDTTLDVLRRRARAAGLPLPEHIRQELIALARRRTADDTVVTFLESEGRDVEPEIDGDAVALVESYDLPIETLGVLGRRARSVGLPLGEYVRRELVRLTRQSSVDDALLEFREAQERDPALEVDMAAVAAAVRYARGE